MTAIWQVTLLGTVATTIVFFWMVAERNRRSRFSSRSVPKFGDWYRQYYGKDGNLPAHAVEAVVVEIARSIGIQPTQLRPADRIDRELAIPEAKPLDDSIEIIESNICDKFDMKFDFPDDWQTLDDIIRGVVPIIQSNLRT